MITITCEIVKMRENSSKCASEKVKKKRD
jgi:hypothetical protein